MRAMWIIPACTLCLVLCATPAWTGDADPVCTESTKKWLGNGLSDGEKNLILNLHNELRESVANGSLKNGPQNKTAFPKSTNMRKLTWNDGLQGAAQAHSDKCVFAHYRPPSSKWNGTKYGQNLAIGWYTDPDEAATPDWRSFIMGWFNEYLNFPPNKRFQFKMLNGTGHFTQLIWADSAEVGCYWTQYVDSDPPNAGANYTGLYTCNYYPIGNNVSPDNSVNTSIYNAEGEYDGSTSCSTCENCRSSTISYYKHLCINK